MHPESPLSGIPTRISCISGRIQDSGDCGPEERNTHRLLFVRIVTRPLALLAELCMRTSVVCLA